MILSFAINGLSVGPVFFQMKADEQNMVNAISTIDQYAVVAPLMSLISTKIAMMFLALFMFPSYSLLAVEFLSALRRKSVQT